MKEEKITFKSLRELRQSKGLSQAQLSRLSGVSRELINRIEQGWKHLSGFTAPRIAKALGNVSYKSLIMAQELANWGLNEQKRMEAIAIALKEDDTLTPGTVKIMKNIRKLDYGRERDSFGRVKKLSVYGDDAKKQKDEEFEFGRDSFGRRTKSRRTKKTKDVDLQTILGRDSFGRRVKKEVEPDEDITMKEFFEKDKDTYEERLRALLLKGEQRRKGR